MKTKLFVIHIILILCFCACKPKYKIEVNNRLPGELYFGENKIKDLKKNSKHTIKVDSLGTYKISMVYFEVKEEKKSIKVSNDTTGVVEHGNENEAENEIEHEVYDSEKFIQEKIIIISKKGKVKTNFHQVLKIGSEGPAGGYIFHYRETDKKGQWQYLEAAPADTEVIAPWGVEDINIIRTQSEIGTGFKNTSLIVDFIDKKELMNFAPDTCYYLEVNGSWGWFLPSIDELDSMYQNLKEKGLGNFEEDWYWSSTQNRPNTAWAQNFKNGEMESNYIKNSTLRVRAIRGI